MALAAEVSDESACLGSPAGDCIGFLAATGAQRAQFRHSFLRGHQHEHGLARQLARPGLGEVGNLLGPDGVITIEKNGLPTASDYLREHGPLHIAKRMLKGLYAEVFRVTPAALAPAAPVPKAAAFAWGVAVLGFAVAGWWLRRRSWDATFVFFWSAAFVTYFGWDHLFQEIRYLAPLVPVWIAFAAHAISSIRLRTTEPRTARLLQQVAVVAVVMITVGWTAASGALTRPQPMLEISPSYTRLLDWMNRTIEPGDRVLMGPTKEFYGMEWTVERPVSIIQTPDGYSLESLLRYLRERRVRYFVLNSDNAYGFGGSLASEMAPYVELQPGGAVVERQPLPGWRPVYSDSASSRRFIVYEAETFAP